MHMRSTKLDIKTAPKRLARRRAAFKLQCIHNSIVHYEIMKYFSTYTVVVKQVVLVQAEPVQVDLCSLTFLLEQLLVNLRCHDVCLPFCALRKDDPSFPESVHH